MDQFADIVARYFAVWNEMDADRRRALIAQTWTEESSYLDPLMQGNGHSGIEALVQAVHQQFPGYRFRQIGAVDGHHNHIRFSWELGPVEGQAPIGGTDVATLADDGRLQRVLGFLDKVPAAALDA